MNEDQPPSPWIDIREIVPDAVRQIRSHIAADAQLRGDLRCVSGERDDVADVVAISGHVEGDVDGYDAVVVRAGGRLDGDVAATTVVIDGALNGTVDAPRRVELRPNARFFGELEPMPDLLVISPDAVFGRDADHVNPLGDLLDAMRHVPTGEPTSDKSS